MCSTILRFARSLVGAALVILFLVPQTAVAQDSQHIVSPSDLEKAAVDASQARQKNLDTLNNFLSTDKARQALEKPLPASATKSWLNWRRALKRLRTTSPPVTSAIAICSSSWLPLLSSFSSLSRCAEHNP